MLYGRDVSNHQGKYNWAGLDPKPGFGFAKATEGTGFVDSFLPWNWGEMQRLGILRGAYHFAHPSEDADAQANLFVATVRKAGAIGVDDVLVLDLEDTDGLGPSAVAAWADDFTAAVEAATGKNVWVYTDHSFILNGCCAGLYDRPLWIASPGTAGEPGSVAPWAVWSCHQYGTDNAGVDEDVLNGDATVWKALANIPAARPPLYKTVPASFTASWPITMPDLVKKFGADASTMLRMSAEHDPNGLFTADLAEWINGALEAASEPFPAGTVIWYPKREPVS